MHPRHLAPEPGLLGVGRAVGVVLEQVRGQPLQRHHHQRVLGAGRQEQVRAATKCHVKHGVPQEWGRQRGLALPSLPPALCDT
jgi:hypothetical protein